MVELDIVGFVDGDVTVGVKKPWIYWLGFKDFLLVFGKDQNVFSVILFLPSYNVQNISELAII